MFLPIRPLQVSLFALLMTGPLVLAQRGEQPAPGRGQPQAKGAAVPASHPALPGWKLVPSSESGLGKLDPDVKVPWFDSPRDVNGDGHLDFVVMPHHTGAGVSAMWYINDGKGRFTPKKVLAIHERIPARKVYEGVWPMTGVPPNWHDLNGDGRPDMVTFGNSTWLNLGNHNYKPISGFGTGEETGHQAFICADGSGIFRHWPDADGIKVLDPCPSVSNGKDISDIQFKAMGPGWSWKEMGVDLFDKLPKEYVRPGIANPSYCVDLDGDHVLDLIVRRRSIGALYTSDLRGGGKPINHGWKEFCRAWVLRGQPGKPLRVANKEMGLPDELQHTFVALDLNHDGHMDLLDVYTGATYHNDGKGNFKKGPGKITPAPEFADDGHVWLMDLANTGRQSFFISANHAYAPHWNQTDGLYVNEGSGNFTRVAPPWGGQAQTSGWYIIPGDFTGDGFLDFVVLQDGEVRLYRNQGIPGNHYLTVVPIQKYKCNAAMGCKLWVYRTGQLGNPEGLLSYQQVDRDSSSYRKASATFLHAGLGKTDHVDVRLRFPITGKVVELKNVKTDATLQIKEEE
jgi:hypothetical protein